MRGTPLKVKGRKFGGCTHRVLSLQYISMKLLAILLLILFCTTFITFKKSNTKECFSNNTRTCTTSKTGQVWCYGKNSATTGNEICGHPSDYSGKYYPLTKDLGQELYEKAIFRDKTDCATNYFTYREKAPGGAINSSSMKCWDEKRKWARGGTSISGAHIVRCTNLEKKEKPTKLVSNDKFTCTKRKNNEVWCYEKKSAFGTLTGNELCERPKEYQGSYYPLTKEAAGELFPHSTFEKKKDCATNYFQKGGSIYSSNMTCWDDEKRWKRKKSPIVRCTNREKPSEPPPAEPTPEEEEKQEEQKNLVEEIIQKKNIEQPNNIEYCKELDGLLCKQCEKGYKLTQENKVCSPIAIANCKTQEEELCKKCNEGYNLSKNTCLATPILNCKKQTDTICSKCISPYKGPKCEECEDKFIFENGKCKKGAKAPKILNIIEKKCSKMTCPKGYTKKEGFTNQRLLAAAIFPNHTIGSLL